MRAAEFDLREIAVDDHHRFLVDRRALHDLAVRRGDERLAPEHDAVLVDRLALGVLDDLVADAVRHADVAAVGDRVAALDRLPRIVLRFAVLLALGRVPADRGGVEEDLGALHRGQPRAFGEPLIPAHQRADRRHLGLPRDEAGVAGREIELLVEQRIVRDVHLAIHAHQRPVGVDDRRGVVIHAGGALLEQRRDDDGLVFLRELAERVGRRPRDRLREREEAMVFDLAEILRAEQFLGAEDLRALLQRLFRERELVGEVPFRILAARHLRKTYLDDRRRGIRLS